MFSTENEVVLNRVIFNQMVYELNRRGYVLSDRSIKIENLKEVENLFFKRYPMDVEVVKSCSKYIQTIYDIVIPSVVFKN